MVICDLYDNQKGVKMIKELTIELTTKCQLECHWCSSSYEKEGELSLETIYEILLQKKEEGFSVLRLSGGEPTLYPELLEVIMLARQLDYKIILLSNGLIKYLNVGIDKYEISYSTEAVPTIEWLIKMNRNVSINIVGVREANVPEAVEYAISRNIPIHIMKLQKTGRAKTSNLTEIDISISGQNGCGKHNKSLYTPLGDQLHCASEKGNNDCSICQK